jgi:hypothetical protein
VQKAGGDLIEDNVRVVGVGKKAPPMSDNSLYLAKAVWRSVVAE